MKSYAVTSSNIVAIGYDPESLVARVDFTSGDSYLYEGVPAETAAKVTFAQSIGKAFNVHLKPWKKFRKMTPEELRAEAEARKVA